MHGPLASNPEIVRAFFETLSRHAVAAFSGAASPGYLQLTRISPHDGSLSSQRFRIDDVNGITAAALGDAAAGNNVYVEGRTVSGSGARGKDDDTVGVFALVIDRDADKGKAGVALAEPSMTVETSPGNCHEWLFLAQALPWRQAKALGAALRAASSADSPTGKITQPYRVPGTPNLPDKRKAALGRTACPTRIVDASGLVWGADDLAERCKAAPKAATTDNRAPADTDALLARCGEATRRALAEPGEDRSEHLFSVIGWLKGEGLTIEEAGALIRAFPDGAGSKYRSRSDLDAEVIRCWSRTTDVPAAGGQAPSWPAFTASDLAGRPIPPQPMHVQGWVPGRNVTLFSGDGGLGKTQIALQLGVSTAAMLAWLGLPVAHGRVLYISAEEEADEIHRRLAVICEAQGIELGDLDKLRIVPLAELDAVLAVPDKADAMRRTPLYNRLKAEIAEWQPLLLIIDNQADVFGGDEIKRIQVRWFIGMLRGLSIKHDMATVLLSHPSLTGMSSGSGLSGSTHWNNSVRSRIYLEAQIAKEDGRIIEPDPDVRVLSNKKMNYGRKGQKLRVRWVNGVFVPEHNEVAAPLIVAVAEERAERIFFDLLAAYEAEKRHVSATPGTTYAPAIFASDSRAEGLNKRALREAMNRLFAAERIKVEEFGPPSRRRSRIVAV